MEEARRVPSRGARVAMRRGWTRWLELAAYIGDFQSRLILTSLYFTFIAPFAVIARFLVDPLRGRGSLDSRWVPRSLDRPTLDTARRQY